MKRVLSLLLVSLLTVVIGTTRTSSQSTSDEETLKKLELERAKHAGNSDADIAFGKSINAEHVVTVDALGHVSDQTPGDVEKMSLGTRKADPDAKIAVVDTWQKRAGHWKLLAQAFVATDAIPAEYYKLPPPPGSTEVK